MATLTLILALIMSLQEPGELTRAQADAEAARAAADAVGEIEPSPQAAVEVPVWRDAATCRQATAIKERIIAVAVRFGERDPDLMTAWLEADAIAARACVLVAAQVDVIDAPD